MKLLAPAYRCCTQNEAWRLARFLAETLKLLTHWKEDANTFRKECQQHPGFKRDLTDPKAPPVSYVEFVRLNFKWHVRLAKMFSSGLKSKEYTEMRNCLIMLRASADHFPAIKKHYAEIEKRVQVLEESDRQDIKMMALAYRAQLKKRAPDMVTDEVFRRDPPGKSSSKPASAKSSQSSVKSGDNGPSSGKADTSRSAEGKPDAKRGRLDSKAKVHKRTSPPQPSAARDMETEPTNRDSSRKRGRAESSQDTGRDKRGRDSRDSRRDGDAAVPRSVLRDDKRDGISTRETGTREEKRMKRLLDRAFEGLEPKNKRKKIKRRMALLEGFMRK